MMTEERKGEEKIMTMAEVRNAKEKQMNTRGVHP